MASSDQSSVIRRPNRGRTDIDVKAKTDSGCFVDYDVDKQTNSDKSPPRSKTESIFKSKQAANVNSTGQNVIDSTNRIYSIGTIQNEVVDAGEMNFSDGSFNDEEANGTSRDSRRDSSLNDRPNDDFYCLYYSDSPNGSLTRNKDKGDTSAFRFDQDDIGAKAEELLQKVKTEALKAQSKNGDNKVDQPKRKPPPVAPKPRKTSKTEEKPSKDPILDELEKLGASVGRDFSDEKEDDPQLFSNAVKHLQVAKTAEECLDRFDQIQTALLENIPDTLERKKKTSKEELKRSSNGSSDKARKLSESSTGSADRVRKLSDSSTASADKVRKLSNGTINSKKDAASTKPKDTKRPDPPKPPKKKLQVKSAFSRTERESLHLMKDDSHHKRSHLNDNVKTPPLRPDSYKTSKSEAPKRLAERAESNKENPKKDKKASTPAKGAKISKKVDVPSRSQRSDGNASAKRKERLELRSSRRRMNGDLTSIPEDAVIGVKIEDLGDNAIPLAKGEDDLSSDEDDLDKYEEDQEEMKPESTYQEMEFPPPPTSNELYLTPKNVSSIIKTVETCTSTSTTASTNFFAGFRTTPQNTERIEKSLIKPSSQRISNRSQMTSLSSDGWTSESTAGYSSANDADDEIERNQELETSEDFETYNDPEDIADMTFGTVIDAEEVDEYVFVQDTPYRIPRSDAVIDKRQRLQREQVITSAVTQHSNVEMSEPQLPLYDIQSQGNVAEIDSNEQYAYDQEYFDNYDNDGEDMYYGNLAVGVSSETTNQQVVLDEIAHDNIRTSRYGDLDSHQQHHVQQTPRRKSSDERGPDPSGFMTVQDIKRLIFQGAKPSIPRSSSFCGGQSSLTRPPNDDDFFQRQSWSGYSSRQQQHSVIDPLVRDFPQRKVPVEEPKRSPYVRTVIQPQQTLQHDCYSDSNINSVNKGRRNVGRSQSFCGASQQRRTNSLDNYHVNMREAEDTGRRSRSFCDALAQWRSNSVDNQLTVRQKSDSERRSRSFCEMPMQRRAHSLDNPHYVSVNGKPMRSQSFKGLPTQRRANSLDEYYSTGMKASMEYQRSPPVMPQGSLYRSTADSPSDYSHSDREHQHLSRASNFRAPPPQQYIDAEELARLLSSQATSEVICQQNNVQQRNANGRSTLPRKSSESLRIQAIRRASHMNSDSDSDSYVENYKRPPPPKSPSSKQNIVAAANPIQRKTLSERFSEVPQRVSLEELAEQLNLPSSDEDDDVVEGCSSVKAESEFGADLEFDYGDYFDDNNMIVGEALRLKKVLGCSADQDPELETLVSKVTDPNAQTTQSVEVQTGQSQRTDEYLTLERPPPYHQVTCAARGGPASPNYSSSYDTDGSYPSESEHSDYSPKSNSPPTSYAQRTNGSSHERRDSQTQTNGDQPQNGRAISTEELLKLIITSSKGNLSEPAKVPLQQKPQSVVQKLLFPAPQTKAASTGNIHSQKTFPGHVAQLYGNTDVNGDTTNLNRRRHQTTLPMYHKSHESLRKGRPSSASVLRAKLVSSSENVRNRSTPTGRVFEEEVDCMRTKGAGDFSSGEFSSGSSVEETVENKSPVASVAYIGCEETKTLETLPRVRSASQRKRRKEKIGFLSDQDIPTGVNNDKDSTEELKVMLPNEKMKPTLTITAKPNEVKSDSSTPVTLTRKDVPKLELNRSDSPVLNSSDTSTPDQIIHFPNENHPSPNSVNVFIDYKKNVMKVTTSTPKLHHGKLINASPTGLSPVTGSPAEQKKTRSPKSSIGQEEIPPRYDSSSSSERSSSVYSSDDEKFFGSCDTVVFVDKTAENQSDKPTTDVALIEDQEPCTNNGHNGLQDEEAINAYTARVDSLLREVRSSLDVDSIGSELLDQAMERVKDKLSPRSPRASEVRTTYNTI